VGLSPNVAPPGVGAMAGTLKVTNGMKDMRSMFEQGYDTADAITLFWWEQQLESGSGSG
jgi:hypothetical protein